MAIRNQAKDLIMSFSNRTVFSIPVHLLAAGDLPKVARIFHLTEHAIAELLAQEPDPHAEGDGDEQKLRLVQGCPCLVIQSDEWHQDGLAESDDLNLAGIAYVRASIGNRDYLGSRTVCDGTTCVGIRLDMDGEVVIGVQIENGCVRILEEELADVERSVAIANRILLAPLPTGTALAHAGT